jgi:ABC-type nitrate/sulfonate/bicarbonate transport system permease component
MTARLKIWALRGIILTTIVVAWELASGRLISLFFVSRPSLIVEKFWKILIDGTLLHHMAITTGEAVAGFIIGGTAGAAIGPRPRPQQAAGRDPRSLHRGVLFAA